MDDLRFGPNTSNGLGLPLLAVPKPLPATVNSPQSKQPSLRRAVIYAVTPTANNPTACSVLIENRLPAKSGFTMPAGAGQFYKSGTVVGPDGRIYANAAAASGVTTKPAPGPFYCDPLTQKGGTFCLVDTENMAVVQILQGASQSFPNSAANLISTHVHTGSVDSNGNPMPQPVDLQHHTQNTIGTGQLPSNAPVAPTVERLYVAGDTNAHATTIRSFANLQGVLQDFAASTWLSNIGLDAAGHVDKSINALQFCIRKTTDPVVTIPGQGGAYVYRSFINSGQTLGIEPPLGSLVVIFTNNSVVTDGFTPIVSSNADQGTSGMYTAYKVWQQADVGTGMTAQVVPGSLNVPNVIATFIVQGFDATNPIASFSIGAYTSNTSPGNAHGAPITPNANHTLVLSGIASSTLDPGIIPTLSAGFTAGPATSVDFQSIYNTTIATAQASSLSSDQVTAISPVYTLDVSLANAHFNTVTLSIASLVPGGVSGGTVYPWTYVAQESLPGLPTPSAEQNVLFAYGKVYAGVGYDLGVAYVNVGGIIGPITPFAIGYQAIDVAIPGQYLIAFDRGYVPVVVPGLPAINGNSGIAPISVSPNSNGLTSSIQLAFEITNQPIDGSFGSVGIFYRNANYSLGFVSAGSYGSAGSSDGWSFYAAVEAFGYRNPLASLPLIGKYVVVLEDLSNDANYDFALTAISSSGGAVSVIVPIGSITQPIKVSPPGLANGSANLCPDANFAAAAPFHTGTGGFSHTQVAGSDPYWHFNGLNGTSTVISQENGGILQQDIADSGHLLEAFSSSIAIAPGDTHTLSVDFDNANQIVAGSGNSGGPYCALVNVTGGPSFTTTYAKSGHGTGIQTCQYVNTGTTTMQVAVMISNDACHIAVGGYFRGGKPMLSRGGQTAYTVGPATPSGQSQTTQSLAIAPSGTSAATVANSPTVTSGAGTPTSGTTAPLADQQPQGSLRIRTDATSSSQSLYTQTSSTTASPTWTTVGSAGSTGSTIGFGAAFPTAPAPIQGQAFFRTDLVELYAWNITGATGAWVKLSTQLLKNLNDVLITSPASGDLLSYDATAGKFVNKPAPAAPSGGGATNLGSLTDVSVVDSSLSGSEVLTFVAGTTSTGATSYVQSAKASCQAAGIPTNLSIALTNPPVAGHTMYAFVADDNDMSVAFPAGWTIVQTIPAGGGENQHLVIYEKTAAASDQTTTVTISGPRQVWASIWILEFVNGSAISQFTVGGSTNPTQTTASLAIPAGAVAIAGFGAPSGSYVNNSTGWTDLVNTQSYNSLDVKVLAFTTAGSAQASVTWGAATDGAANNGYNNFIMYVTGALTTGTWQAKASGSGTTKLAALTDVDLSNTTNGSVLTQRNDGIVALTFDGQARAVKQTNGSYTLTADSSNTTIPSNNNPTLVAGTPLTIKYTATIPTGTNDNAAGIGIQVGANTLILTPRANGDVQLYRNSGSYTQIAIITLPYRLDDIAHAFRIVFTPTASSCQVDAYLDGATTPTFTVSDTTVGYVGAANVVAYVYHQSIPINYASQTVALGNAGISFAFTNLTTGASTLAALTDVDATTKGAGKFLTYNSATAKFDFETPAGGGGGAPSATPVTFGAYGGTNPTAGVTASSTYTFTTAARTTLFISGSFACANAAEDFAICIKTDNANYYRLARQSDGNIVIYQVVSGTITNIGTNPGSNGSATSGVHSFEALIGVTAQGSNDITFRIDGILFAAVYGNTALSLTGVAQTLQVTSTTALNQLNLYASNSFPILGGGSSSSPATAAGSVTPVVVQKNKSWSTTSGVVSLNAPPSQGNTVVVIFGYHPNGGVPGGAGFASIVSAATNPEGVVALQHVVLAGETGSYTFSGADVYSAQIFEISGLSTILSTSNFSANSTANTVSLSGNAVPTLAMAAFSWESPTVTSTYTTTSAAWTDYGTTSTTTAQSHSLEVQSLLVSSGNVITNASIAVTGNPSYGIAGLILLLGGTAAPSTAAALPFYDQSPTTPGAFDDEFNATTLATIWSVINSTPGNTSRTVTLPGDGKAYFDSPYTTTDRVFGIVQAAPTVAFTITAKIGMSHVDSTLYAGPAIIIVGAAAVVQFQIVDDNLASPLYASQATFMTPGSLGLSSVSSFLSSSVSPTALYYKVTFDGTNYRFYVSTTGYFSAVNLHGIIAASSVGAISKIGVGMQPYGTFAQTWCDFFRVTLP